MYSAVEATRTRPMAKYGNLSRLDTCARSVRWGTIAEPPDLT